MFFALPTYRLEYLPMLSRKEMEELCLDEEKPLRHTDRLKICTRKIEAGVSVKDIR